jgi:hypothetical protein
MRLEDLMADELDDFLQSVEKRVTRSAAQDGVQRELQFRKTDTHRRWNYGAHRIHAMNVRRGIWDIWD